jgi:hypothetical protein
MILAVTSIGGAIAFIRIGWGSAESASEVAVPPS